MGEQFDGGFVLDQVSIQVFEHKPKEPKKRQRQQGLNASSASLEPLVLAGARVYEPIVYRTVLEGNDKPPISKGFGA
jgi:hypothetical protein